MTASQNGYRAISSTSSRLLYRWEFPGADTEMWLRRGPAGFVLVHFGVGFDRRIEGLHEPTLDDWGWAFRAIRGFVALSNHASGTAMDLNATDHPLGVEDTFDTLDQRRIQKMLRRYDGCLRWGGNYNGRKDDMHIELDKPMRDVAVLARKLAKTDRGKAILAANPGQRRLIVG